MAGNQSNGLCVIGTLANVLANARDPDGLANTSASPVPGTPQPYPGSSFRRGDRMLNFSESLVDGCQAVLPDTNDTSKHATTLGDVRGHLQLGLRDELEKRPKRRVRAPRSRASSTARTDASLIASANGASDDSLISPPEPQGTESLPPSGPAGIANLDHFRVETAVSDGSGRFRQGTVIGHNQIHSSLRLAEIVDSPHSPRRDSDNDLQPIVASLAEFGQLNAIKVRPIGNGLYEVVEHNRLIKALRISVRLGIFPDSAAVIEGTKLVDVSIDEVDEVTAMRNSIEASDCGRPLSPFEKCLAVDALWTAQNRASKTELSAREFAGVTKIARTRALDSKRVAAELTEDVFIQAGFKRPDPSGGYQVNWPIVHRIGYRALVAAAKEYRDTIRKQILAGGIVPERNEYGAPIETDAADSADAGLGTVFVGESGLTAFHAARNDSSGTPEELTLIGREDDKLSKGWPTPKPSGMRLRNRAATAKSEEDGDEIRTATVAAIAAGKPVRLSIGCNDHSGPDRIRAIRAVAEAILLALPNVDAPPDRGFSIVGEGDRLLVDIQNTQPLSSNSLGWLYSDLKQLMT